MNSQPERIDLLERRSDLAKDLVAFATSNVVLLFVEHVLLCYRIFALERIQQDLVVAHERGGLRLLIAALELLHHVEQVRVEFQLDSSWGLARLRRLEVVAVALLLAVRVTGLLPAVVVLILADQLVIEIEDEVQSIEPGLEVTQVVRCERYVLVADEAHVRRVSEVLAAELLNPLVELAEGMASRLQCRVAEDAVSPKGLGKVGGFEEVGSLEYRVQLVAACVLHDLADDVLVDLAEAAVEHFPALEHVEDPIAEDFLAVHGAIDVEEELCVAEVGVNREAVAVPDVKGQQECLLLQICLEHKICEDLVLALGLVLDRERQPPPLNVTSVSVVSNVVQSGKAQS